VLAVGYRARSERGTQFRQWATAPLQEYLVKDFAMDDERLKNPPGPGIPDYFDELLERVGISACGKFSPSPPITSRARRTPRDSFKSSRTSCISPPPARRL
jgi:hypothetical protein